ncbi:MAG: Uma2 family endonuclease, partial [Planctomycetia bacterium]
MAAKLKVPDVEYPESDGKPLAETDVHIDLVLSLRERLKAFFAHDPNVYVAGNLFVYYVEGRPKVCLAPDGFVSFGVPDRRRR